MSLVPILLIIGAVALMVGPVMMLQPSARQRQLGALRTKALSLGLKVRMREYKGDSIAEYSKSWRLKEDEKFAGELWSLLRQNIEHDIHFHRDWDWEGEAVKSDTLKARLHEAVERCPDSIVGLSANTLGVSCLWAERGGQDALEQVSRLLDQLSADCISSVPPAAEDLD